MAGSSSSPSFHIQETDTTVLKETLRSQQQLLQRLYAELDVEREASATATNEALSMILRLQGEKAALKMEASQYKRMAEEKICHAEESLAIFEDLMYQKEMEISSLESQIQAYKYKLLSLGCEDFDDFGVETPLSERNDAFLSDKGVIATVRRLSSLPTTLPIDFHQMKSPIDGERDANPEPDLCLSTDVGNHDKVVHDHKGSLSRRSSLTADDFNSYWEQIRMLEEKVKQISDCKEDSPSKVSTVNVESVSRTTNLKLPPKHLKIKTRRDSLERESIATSSAGSPSAVHDIFEVTDVYEVSETSTKNKTFLNEEKSQGKSILGEGNRLKKPDSIPKETFEPPSEDEIDWIKRNNFLSAKPEKKSCELRDDIKADFKSPPEYKTEWLKKNKLLDGNIEKKLSEPWDQTDADCKSALFHPATGKTDYGNELQQLTQRVEQLESGRNNSRDEISEVREEELNLLKELREQLNSIQSEMRSWRSKKSSPLDEVPLHPLTEAMLYFWL